MAFTARAVNKARAVGFAPTLLLVIFVFYLGFGQQVFIVLVVFMAWQAALAGLAACSTWLEAAPQAHRGLPPPRTRLEYRAWLLRCTHVALPAEDQPLEFYQRLYEKHAGAAAPAVAVSPGPAVPAARSLSTARLLWAVAPPLGLHHLYLWRDASFVLHVLTLGGFGVGWLVDGVLLASYVDAANASLGSARDVGAAAMPPGTFIDGTGQVRTAAPPQSTGRCLAMVASGAYFGCLFHAATPAMAVGAHPLLDVRWFAQACGAALGAWLVASAPPLFCSARAALAAAALGALSALLHSRKFLLLVGPFIFTFSPHAYHILAGLLLPLSLRYGLAPAAAAAAACIATSCPAPPATPRRTRPAAANARRALLLVACAVAGWGVTGYGALRGRLPLLSGAASALRNLAAEGSLRDAWAELRRAAGASAGFRFSGAEGGAEEDREATLARACAALGLSAERPSLAALKAAHRLAALATHPDKLPPDATDEDRADAAARFGEVQAAYDLLLSKLKTNGEAKNARQEGGGGAGGDAATRAPSSPAPPQRDEL